MVPDLSSSFPAQAFGLRWTSDRLLDQFSPAPGDGRTDVTVRCVEFLPERLGGVPFNNGEIFPDGVRFRFGDATFDTFGGDRVDWHSPSNDEIPAAFYGTVAALILVWRGMVPLHGSAVALGGQAVMIAGDPGAGKSSLCAALVRQGGLLVSDDLSALLPLPRASAPMLQPGRPAIRLVAEGLGSRAGDKILHSATMVDQTAPIPFAAMVVLRDEPIAPGPADAVEALRRELFRPLWMRALPFRRERTQTILHAAPRIAMLTLPSAVQRPELAVDEKAEKVISDLRRLGIVHPGALQ